MPLGQPLQAAQFDDGNVVVCGNLPDAEHQTKARAVLNDAGLVGSKDKERMQRHIDGW